MDPTFHGPDVDESDGTCSSDTCEILYASQYVGIATVWKSYVDEAFYAGRDFDDKPSLRFNTYNFDCLNDRADSICILQQAAAFLL